MKKKLVIGISLASVLLVACVLFAVFYSPKEILATSVTLNEKGQSLKIGESLSLSAVISPSDVTDKTLTWTSSDPEVAMVENGTVRALSAGTAAIIVATENGKTAVCMVTVPASQTPPSEAEALSLDRSTLSLTVGEEQVLTASVFPSDAADKTLTWTSSDPAVATVENGTVRALSAGTAAVVASTSNGKTAVCTVTVRSALVAVQSLELDPHAISLAIGKTFLLTASVSPAEATDKSLTWTSSDPAIASVENGTVRALSAGTAVIVAATGNGKTAVCTVTVPYSSFVAVESVTLSQNQLSLSIGNTLSLTASVSPSDATYKSLTWTSSDPAVATVKDGVVQALSSGTAAIVATAHNGTTAACMVTVGHPFVAVESLVLEKSVSLEIGGTQLLSAEVFPADATDKALIWTSSNPSVAIVENGVVQALSAGTARVTATSHNGQTAACLILVCSSTDDFTFFLENDGYTVTAYLGTGPEVVIPNTYKGRPVTKISDKVFANNDNLKFVAMPDSIISIGQGAFQSCTWLKSIVLSRNLLSISNSAFMKCSRLESIVLPNSLTELGEQVFSHCSSLENIVIPDGITSLKDSVFNTCTSLKSVILPSSLASIEDSAFTGCTSLESIDFPGSLASIGASAFTTCISLESIAIPDSVTFIGNDAFNCCERLQNIVLPDKGLYLDKSTFINTAYYRDQTNWEDQVLYIGKHLIAADPQLSGSYTVKSGTLSIAAFAFSNCGIQNLVLPESVVYIGTYAFHGCYSLESVTFENAEGWVVSLSSNMEDSIALDDKELQDPAKAASLFKGLYGGYCWKRG